MSKIPAVRTATLEDAISLAAWAHKGQLDMAGQPYILHALHVMMQQTTDDAGIVGVLHDVVEDTSISLCDILERGFGSDVGDAIYAITRQDGEEYGVYIDRVMGNMLASVVKWADLKHNLDRRRFPANPPAAFYSLCSRYRKALKKLEDYMSGKAWGPLYPLEHKHEMPQRI